EKYVAEGGGLWVILGPRTESGRDDFNSLLHREGKGPLPAALERINLKKDSDLHLDARRWLHPSLDIFKISSLDQIAVHGWWTLTGAAPGSSLAMLSSGEPWLLQKPFGKGRVLVSTLPMDRTWDNELPPAWEFPVLVHELTYLVAQMHGSTF